MLSLINQKVLVGDIDTSVSAVVLTTDHGTHGTAEIFSLSNVEAYGDKNGFLMHLPEEMLTVPVFSIAAYSPAGVFNTQIVKADLQRSEAPGPLLETVNISGRRYLKLFVIDALRKCGLIDLSHLAKQNAEFSNAFEFAVAYLADKSLWDLSPHPLFWGQWYRNKYSLSECPPLVDYVLGDNTARDPNPLFDSPWFLKEYDINCADIMSPRTPLLLYIKNFKNYPSTSRFFDGDFYNARNPDVAEGQAIPLVHYVVFGEYEGREVSPYVPHKTSETGNPLIVFNEAIADRDYTQDVYEREYREMLSYLRAIPTHIRKPAPSAVKLARDFEVRHLDQSQRSQKAKKYTAHIIIPMFNAVEATTACLDSIFTVETSVSFRVTVVDDGSTADLSVLEKYTRLPNFHVVHKENQGYLKTSNYGVKLVDEEFVVLMNSDVIVDHYFLDDLLGIFASEEGVGIVAPTILYPSGHLQEQGGYFNELGQAKWITRYRGGGARTRAHKVDYASGVMLVCRTSTWKKLGGYDEAFAPAYCEDSDLCIRLQKAGLHVYVAENVFVWHALSQSYRQECGAIGVENLDPDRLLQNKVYLSSVNSDKLFAKHKDFFATKTPPRVIAFYLPQFHQILENNKYWGRGFTEWTNVTRAKPQFEGHTQPLLPSAGGFYDLNNEEVEDFQFSLAKKYGIDAFCYYFYWLNNKPILDLPLKRRINGKYKYPFCLCWANENWTRAWDGQNSSVLLEQKYDDASMEAMFGELSTYLKIPEYLTINGRPLLLIYNVRGIPDAEEKILALRTYVKSQISKDIFVGLVESFELFDDSFHPSKYHADAVISFAPHGLGAELSPGATALPVSESFAGKFYDYVRTAGSFIGRRPRTYTQMQCVMPGWDNTARRGNKAGIFINNTPGKYRAWIEEALNLQKQTTFGEEQIVFVNAWNEWAEGAILEPSQKDGYDYLEATRDAKLKLRKFFK